MMRASVSPFSQGAMPRRTALAKLATEHARNVRAAEDRVLGIKPHYLPDVVRMLRLENRMPSAEAAAIAGAVAVQRRAAVTPKGRRFERQIGPDGKDYRVVVGKVRRAAKPGVVVATLEF